MAVLAIGCGEGSSSHPSARETGTSAALSGSVPPALTSSAESSAAAPNASAAPGAATTVTAQPFLWEVKAKDKRSHLFGTMHIGTDAEKELHPIVFDRLDGASELVIEANVFDIDPMSVLDLSMLPEGKTIHDKMKKEHWELLVDKIGGLLMPESTLRRMKPWFLVTLLTQDLLPVVTPMEQVLHDRAKKANKTLGYLETVEEQLAIIDKAIDVKVLDDMLGELPTFEKTLLDLAAAYKTGDLVVLEKLAFDPVEMKKHPAMFDEVLYARNQRWIPKLSARLDKGGTFVAVGAAHLVGAKSVIALLKDKGYVIERVPLP
jgi:hypothetical protein